MLSIATRNKLVTFFAIFKDIEIAYVTSCGLILKQEDLEKAVEVLGANDLQGITRNEVLGHPVMAPGNRRNVNGQYISV